MNISYQNKDKILVNKITKHISTIYGENFSKTQIDHCCKKVISLIDRIQKDDNQVDNRWSEETVVLITYANSIIDKKNKPLKVLDKFLSNYCR